MWLEKKRNASRGQHFRTRSCPSFLEDSQGSIVSLTVMTTCLVGATTTVWITVWPDSVTRMMEVAFAEEAVTMEGRITIESDWVSSTSYVVYTVVAFAPPPAESAEVADADQRFSASYLPLRRHRNSPAADAALPFLFPRPTPNPTPSASC
jgi:hypothetical protein